MRFLFVGPAVCLRLPSDPASRRAPLPSTHRSPCRASRGLGMLRARRTSWREPMPGADRVGGGVTPRRPPTPPYVRFRIRRFTKPSASVDGVREGSPVHLCSLGSPLPLPAVTFDAPLALPRRFRRLPPAADSGISAILSSVCFVIEVRASTPAPCSGLRPRRAGLLCPLLTSDGSVAPLDAPCRPCRATRPQISPGKNSHLPAYARRIYFRAFRAGTGLRVFCALSSNAAASYAIPVRSGQRFVSGFLQIPPRDGHPCLQLTVPPAGPVEDLACSAHAAPPGESPCRAQAKKKPPRGEPLDGVNS